MGVINLLEWLYVLTCILKYYYCRINDIINDYIFNKVVFQVFVKGEIMKDEIITPQSNILRSGTKVSLPPTCIMFFISKGLNIWRQILMYM